MKAYQHLNVGVTWLEAPTLLRDLQTGHPLKVQVYKSINKTRPRKVM